MGCLCQVIEKNNLPLKFKGRLFWSSVDVGSSLTDVRTILQLIPKGLRTRHLPVLQLG